MTSDILHPSHQKIAYLANLDQVDNLSARLDNSNVCALDGYIGLGAQRPLAVVILAHSLRVAEPGVTLATGADPAITKVSLVCGILMEDLVPVASNGPKAAGNDLVIDADHASLGKVLGPVGAAVAGGSVAVLGVFPLPLGAVREGLLELGQGVEVQAVGELVEQSVYADSVLDDTVSGAVDEGSSSIVEAGGGNELTFL